ncbi:MAG: gluconate 2-dehydrogenase subunit 3 family protein [Verrucomicrobia bacterium]|nr:gluconate 2-dehydrogenase subunit 3 family protein [Verrucomicrobiota bacterium]
MHPGTAQILQQVFRVMYPHDNLDDSCYESVVLGFASKTLVDRDFADLVENGVRVLINQHHWAELSEVNRLEALKQIEDTPFFRAIRTEFILRFYRNPVVWKFLGYEGPSNELGGYLNRGFDDIGWLGGA